MFTYISTNFYFNDLVTEKISPFCFCCFCYRFSCGQFNEFGDQNYWIEQEKVPGYDIGRLQVWPSCRHQKKCHPYGVSPPTSGHTITQPCYRTISMTKYCDEWLQFLASKVSIFAFGIWENVHKTKHYFTSVLNLEKNWMSICCTRERNVKTILSSASSKLIRPFSHNLESCCMKYKSHEN